MKFLKGLISFFCAIFILLSGLSFLVNDAYKSVIKQSVIDNTITPFTISDVKQYIPELSDAQKESLIKSLNESNEAEIISSEYEKAIIKAVRLYVLRQSETIAIDEYVDKTVISESASNYAKHVNGIMKKSIGFSMQAQNENELQNKMENIESRMTDKISDNIESCTQKKDVIYWVFLICSFISGDNIWKIVCVIALVLIVLVFICNRSFLRNMLRIGREIKISGIIYYIIALVMKAWFAGYISVILGERIVFDTKNWCYYGGIMIVAGMFFTVTASAILKIRQARIAKKQQASNQNIDINTNVNLNENQNVNSSENQNTGMGN